MRNLKRFFPMMLMIICLALAGCGSSGSGATPSDPLAPAGGGSGPITGGGTPITSQDPTFNLALSTDLIKPTDLTILPQIDANIGTVLLTAQFLSIQGGVLLDPNDPGGDVKIDAGAPVQNQKITYKIIAGPGTITYPAYSGSAQGENIVTDSNGKSEAVYTAGNVLYTTNVIIEASTTIGGNTYRAYTQFQIVRGTGVIKFLTTQTATDPAGTLNTLSFSVKHDSTATTVTFPQLIPFKVTDSNGNPRVGVPVTLDMYSQSGTAGVVINYLENGVVEPTANTVTTDSSGAGIFNITVTVPVPVTPGFTYSEGIVYKAVTNDAIPLTAYGGFIVSATRQPTP